MQTSFAWALLVLALAPAAAQAQEREIKDCEQCPAMVVMPTGKMMRSDKLGQAEYAVEFRRPFAIAKYEVTRAEFDAFAKVTGGRLSGCSWFFGAGARANPDKDWNAAFDPDVHVQDDQEPALCVSHEDAQDYVAWLREKTGEIYRLPTEAEWEYAARAGSANDAAWWTTANTPKLEMANCVDCPGNANTRPDRLFTFPVGKFPPNAWGLHDLASNAAEWVEDCFNASLANAPKDGAAWLDGDCGQRVARGGSWHHERAVLAGFRQQTPADTSINDIGFRVVRSLHE